MEPGTILARVVISPDKGVHCPAEGTQLTTDRMGLEEVKQRIRSHSLARGGSRLHGYSKVLLASNFISEFGAKLISQIGLN